MKASVPVSDNISEHVPSAGCFSEGFACMNTFLRGTAGAATGHKERGGLLHQSGLRVASAGNNSN